MMDAFWAGLGVWFETYGQPFWVIVIILLAVVAFFVVKQVIKRVVAQIVSGVKRKVDAADTEALDQSPLYQVRIVQRTKAIGSVLDTVVAWVIAVFAIILILATLGVNASALVAAASFIGAAAGIGAQNVIKDFLNGLFMVFEDQLGIGDVVDLDHATGIVESVGIRVTQVRDVNGTVWYVRNGEIVRVGNMSKGWARVIVDLGVPYDADVELVERVTLDIARTLATEPKWRTRIVERPELWGIETVADDAIVMRIVMKSRSNAKDDVARELRARLVRGLAAEGIRLPSLSSVILKGFDGAASVKGSRPPTTDPMPKQTRI